MLRRISSSSKFSVKFLKHFKHFNSLQLQRVLCTASLQKQFLPSDNIKCSIFNGANTNIIRSVLVNNFTAKKEPLCYSISPRNFNCLLTPYLDQAIKDKLSMTIQVNDVFAGIVVNHDFTHIEENDFLEDLKKRDYFGFDMIFEIEKELNRDFRHEMREKGLFEFGNIFRMLLLGIDPQFEHNGFATYLTEKSVKRAKEMGYKYVTGACTNDFMKHALEKCGFECINSIQYDKWEYPKGSGIFPKKGTEEITGFKEMSFMVKKLYEWEYPDYDYKKKDYDGNWK